VEEAGAVGEEAALQRDWEGLVFAQHVVTRYLID
jgi:hypothetical protein